MRIGISLWPQRATWSELSSASARIDELGDDSPWSYDHFIALGSGPTQSVLDSLFEDDVTTFDGMHCTMNDAVLWPKPLQERLPILIGGSGERRTLRIVAEHADLWNAFGTPAVVAHKLAVLRDHCADVARDPATISDTLNCGVIVRDSATEVQARLDEIGEVAGFPDYAASNEPEVMAVMPAPYDHETIERLATDVRPRLDRLLSAR